MIEKKRIFFFVFCLINLWVNFAGAQCSVSNGGACLCPDGSSKCLLLPDLIVSKTAITDSGGYMEYAQMGNGSFNGQFRVTGATPNIGWGPLHVVATDTFYCGSVKSVSSTPPALCPDGKYPRQVVVQKIYHKDTTVISTSEVRSGIMVYHGAGHNHLHIENWFHISLRLKDNLEPDPRKWQVVGEVAKISFCLADFKPCTQANGFCRDSLDQILDNTNMPNYGLGVNYNSCSTEQGISPGFMDIYDLNVPGQSITIPYGTCNGQYYLVAEVDPDNFIVESNEENNLLVIPVMLTKQGGNAIANISSLNGTTLCISNDTIHLESTAGASYVWSTGETTRKISVTQPGKYAVKVVTQCGIAFSDSFEVKKTPLPVIDSLLNDKVCGSGSAILKAYSKDSVYWYSENDSLLYTGSVFTTPNIDTATVFYAKAFNTEVPLDTFHVGKPDRTFPGTYYPGTDYMKFNCLSPFVIKSVKVYADSNRFRIFRLWDANGNELISNTFYVPAGENRVELNFPVPRGNSFQLLCQSPNLWRDDSPFFPYRLPNYIELISSGQEGHYPPVYDWEIIPDAGSCVKQKQFSSKKQVSVYVGKKFTLAISGLDTAYYDTDTIVTIAGLPTGGVFFGPGVSGNTFDPAGAGLGSNMVSYTFTDSLGCTDTISQLVKIKNISAVHNHAPLSSSIIISPNPTSGIFLLTAESMGAVNVDIFDKLGRLVKTESFGKAEKYKYVDMTAFSEGIYMIRVMNETSFYTHKLIVNK